MTPTFSLPSFLFTSPTHSRERGCRSHSSPQATSPVGGSTSDWADFLFPVRCLILTGLCLVLVFWGEEVWHASQSHTATDICCSTGYCWTWSHAKVSSSSLQHRFNVLSVWLTATQATKEGKLFTSVFPAGLIFTLRQTDAYYRLNLGCILWIFTFLWCCLFLLRHLETN